LKKNNNARSLDDESTSLSHYAQAQRLWPASLDVAAWLGALHVRHEAYEAAAPCFELAALVQPREPKWALMAASCYRRAGALAAALERYAVIADAHPGCVEGLRFAAALSGELGRPGDAERYSALLAAAERAQVGGGAVVGGSGGGGSGSAGPTASFPASSFSDGSNFLQQLGRAGADFGAAGVGALMPALQQQQQQPRAAAVDDWGCEQLGEDLLPM
jgi:tetratricopeptide (TPR) repeat protein